MVKIVEKTGATINSTRKFVWVGQEKLEFRDAADAVTMRLFSQGQHNGATPYFFTRDHLGSVREVLSGGGTVVARYDYDPYGRATTLLGTTPTDMNFTGLYRHAKSNLDLAVYRAYDPDGGRWLNRDPIEEKGGINLYRYVKNNPIIYTDPSGLIENLGGPISVRECNEEEWKQANDNCKRDHNWWWIAKTCKIVRLHINMPLWPTRFWWKGGVDITVATCEDTQCN